MNMRHNKKIWLYGVIWIVLSAEAGDFSSGFDRAAELWQSWKSRAGRGTFAHRADYGRRAPGALEIAIDAGNPGKDGGLVFTRRFDGEPGKSYTFMVYTAHSGVNPNAVIALSIQGLDRDGAFLGTGVHGTRLQVRELKAGEWRRLIFTFRAPENGKWNRLGQFLCSLGVSEGTSGQVYFDDFEFFAVKEEGE